MTGETFPIQVISRKEERSRIEGTKRIGDMDGKGEVERIGEAAAKGGAARNGGPNLYKIIECRSRKESEIRRHSKKLSRHGGTDGLFTKPSLNGGR